MAEPMRPSYVYDGVEIVKTGKMAERKLRSGKVDQLIEVTPKEPTLGTWKKWVREAELFEVLPSDIVGEK